MRIKSTDLLKRVAELVAYDKARVVQETRDEILQPAFLDFDLTDENGRNPMILLQRVVRLVSGSSGFTYQTVRSGKLKTMAVACRFDTREDFERFQALTKDFLTEISRRLHEADPS